jgi:quinoprotein glucose dehydrogenase
MNKGVIAWQVPHGGTSAKIRDHAALKGVTLPPLGTGGKAGPLVTKTLLFIGKRGEPGSKDPADAPALIAYDKATGAVAGEIPLPASAICAPMTYLSNGKQFLAVTVLSSPPELIAYALQSSR